MQLNTPVLRTKNCRFLQFFALKNDFFSLPTALRPASYNPTTMTIPHTLAKRPSLNEKAVLPHNSHLCLLSSFTITTVTVTVILIFLMKDGKGPKGLGVIVSPTIAVAVLSLLAITVHCPLSTVAFTITVTMQSLSCHRPLSLLHQCSSYHQYCTPATSGSHCHCVCTVHYALSLSQSLSLCSPYPVTVHCHCHTTVHPRITIVVHCPLSTVAFTITVTMQALGSRKKYNL